MVKQGNAMKKLNADQINFIIKTFLDACHNKKFQEYWMTPDTWAKLIDNYYKPPVEHQFDGVDLLYAVRRTKWLLNAMETSNYVDDTLSLYRNSHRPKGKPVVWAFYASSNEDKPKGRQGKDWHLDIHDAKELLGIKTRSSTLTSLTVNLVKSITSTKELEGIRGTTTGKRKRGPQNNQEIGKPGISNSIAKPLGDEIDATNPLSNDVTSSLVMTPPAAALSSLVTNYWVSTEAIKLFKPKGEEGVLNAIDNQIEVLEQALASDSGYIEIIGNIKELNLNEIPTYQVFLLRQKCMYLTMSLNLAKEQMNNWTWTKCCNKAVEHLRKSGLKQAKNGRTVMEWYREFRQNRNFTVFAPQKLLPPFLEQNPHIVRKIKKYCTLNLAELSVEYVMDYVHNTLLPNLLKEETNQTRQEMGEESYQEKLRSFLKPYQLSTIGVTAIS